jgi:hypothetical protein
VTSSEGACANWGLVLPSGTTWLDLVTLGVALSGVLIAFASLVLTFLRDREMGRVAVQIEVQRRGESVVVQLTNFARRPVAIVAAGLSESQSRFVLRSRGDVAPFTRWQIQGSSEQGSAEPFPTPPLVPGDPPYELTAPVRAIQAHFGAKHPLWAWCEDVYGNTTWRQIRGEWLLSRGAGRSRLTR